MMPQVINLLKYKAMIIMLSLMIVYFKIAEPNPVRDRIFAITLGWEKNFKVFCLRKGKWVDNNKSQPFHLCNTTVKD